MLSLSSLLSFRGLPVSAGANEFSPQTKPLQGMKQGRDTNVGFTYNFLSQFDGTQKTDRQHERLMKNNCSHCNHVYQYQIAK